MDRFSLMNTFVRVVEAGSFSAVAREQGIGQPNVSRHIAGLEQLLGARLLHRSTRKLTLTPQGERYYEEARRILDALGDAEANARGHSEPQGLLRMACPTLLGRSYVLRMIGPLLQRFPKLQIDLQISDRIIDLVEEGIDLSIRIGALKDSSLRARRIGMAQRLCVASRDYLQRRGVPTHPADLKNHDCIVYSLGSPSGVWSFRDVDVAVSGSFRVNSPDGVRSAALQGVGIAYSPAWLFHDALADGRVIAVMKDHLGAPIPIHIVHTGSRSLPPRARAVMDFIAGELARDPALNAGVTAP